MHSGCHGVVQFGIAADRDGGWRRLHANRAFSVAHIFRTLSADIGTWICSGIRNSPQIIGTWTING